MNWKKVIFNKDHSIMDVVKKITIEGTQCGVIVDSDNKLVGVVTDGDIRRGILNGVSFEESITSIMNNHPKFMTDSSDRSEMRSYMKTNRINQLPICDSQGKLLDVLTLDDLLKVGKNKTPVVIMAGGLGSRLGSLTENCPKPLLKLGDRPVLQTILENFIDQGFCRFFFALNYKSQMIIDHFGDGEKWGISIEYILEEEKLGTAGALGLLPMLESIPVIVMNADLLTKVNFNSLLEFHTQTRADATMCVRKYQMQVPYGVVETLGANIVSIKEKPSFDFFISAGVYVINSKHLTKISQNEYIDMPELWDRIVIGSETTNAFPIHEYWIDIGKLEDFERAEIDYTKFFKDKE